MSQTRTRSRRTAVKRNLSVDDINSASSLHSISMENLNESWKTGSNGTGRVVVNSKRRRKQKLCLPQSKESRQTNSQPALQTTEIPAGENHVANEVDTELLTVDQNNVTTDKVPADYINEINALNATVKSLQTKLNFILSFLGIPNDEITQSDQYQYKTVTDSSAIQSESIPNMVVNNNLPQSRKSYADVAQKPSLSLPLRNAVISAVYTDFEEKDRRAKNIVISGLLISSTSDKVAVENLCHSEFGFIPHITKCRRLGQPRQGRVQPTLVTLQSVTDAEFLIRNAKTLRRSSDPVVKDSVYINPDMTRAEALTAYERRCRRRAMAAQRNSTTQSTQSTRMDQQQTTQLDSGRSVRSVPNPSDNETTQSISVINTREPSLHLTATSSSTDQPQLEPCRSVPDRSEDETIQPINVIDAREPSLMDASSLAAQSGSNEITDTIEMTPSSGQLDPAAAPFAPVTTTVDVHLRDPMVFLL